MIKKTLISASVLTAIFLGAVTTLQNYQNQRQKLKAVPTLNQSRLDTVIGQVGWHGRWQLKKVGLNKRD